MYSLIKTFKATSIQFYSDEKLICFNSSHLFKVIKKEDFSPFYEQETERSVFGIHSSSNLLIFKGRRNGESEFFFLNKLSGKRLEKKLPYSLSSILGFISSTKIVFEAYTDASYSKKIISVFDVENGDIIWEKESNHHHLLLEKNIIGIDSVDNSLYYCLNKENGTVEWSLFDNEKNESHSSKILGFSNEHLIAIYNKDKIKKIRLSDNEVISKWGEIPDNLDWLPSTYSFLPGLENAEYLKKEEIICGMHQYYYWELDLLSNEINFFDLTEEFKKKDLIFGYNGAFAKTNTHIIFYSNLYKRNEDKTYEYVYKVAAMNRTIRKIEWIYEFDFPKGEQFRLASPIVDSDFIYVMDSQDNLYIFKKNKATT